MFFHLQPKKAIVNDLNEELVDSLKVIKKSVSSLMNLLSSFEQEHSKDFYYNTRSNHNLTDINQRAARFIYLNKACFNGMYRVNKKNEFNVPFGKKEKISLYSKTNLSNLNNFLNKNKIKIFNLDYIEVLKKAKQNDFVFIDPPYDTENNQFTTYTKEIFGRKQQEELADVLDLLTSKKIKWMLTNSPTEFILNRYKNYNQKIVDVNRMINSNSKKRIKSAKEVIVTNYEK